MKIIMSGEMVIMFYTLITTTLGLLRMFLILLINAQILSLTESILNSKNSNKELKKSSNVKIETIYSIFNTT